MFNVYDVVIKLKLKIENGLFVEVRASIRCTVHAACWYIAGLLQISGAALLRLQKTEDAE